MGSKKNKTKNSILQCPQKQRNKVEARHQDILNLNFSHKTIAHSNLNLTCIH